MSSLNVDVSGHHELSGEYRANEPGARSLIDRYIELGGTVGFHMHTSWWPRSRAGCGLLLLRRTDQQGVEALGKSPES
jgi:hypothetical protein